MAEIPEIPSASQPQEQQIAQGTVAPRRRSPLLAALLSAVLPGAGHIYIGQVARGIGYVILSAAMALLILWASRTHEFVAFPGLILALSVMAGLFWLWVLISAVHASQQRRFAPNLGLILILAYTYLLGWQVTEVDLHKFFTEFPDTFNIFTRVIWPWNAAFEREEQLIIARTKFGNPCGEEDEIPQQVEGDGSQPWVAVDPPCGDFAEYIVGQGLKPGTTLTVYGGGFAPNDTIQIWWRDPIGEEFQPLFEGQKVNTTTDEQGNFRVTFGAPQYLTPVMAQGVQIHEIQARQVAALGPLRLSENFNLAIGRMIVTIFQALMATTFGIVLAIPASFIAARNLMWHSIPTRLVYYVVRFIMNVVRSIEPIIWAVIAAVWVGLGPFAGVIALTLHTIAALGKLYSEAIENIDPGPIEAITATGANRLQVIVYAIIPQVIPPFLSFTIYRWDINVRMSTIIGFVGGGGIGQVLFQWINQSRWNAAGMAVWLIAITVSIMDYASAELRKRFV